MFLSTNMKKKTRVFPARYLKLRFVLDDANETKPYSLWCCMFFLKSSFAMF